MIGAGAKLPKQSAVMATIIGGLGGFMLAYQQSSGRQNESCMGFVTFKPKLASCYAGRLMGFFPNDKEVETGLANKR